MKLPSLAIACGLAAALLLAVPAQAQGSAAAPRPASSGLHMIVTPGMSLTMDGNRVLAKATRRGITTYHYEQGRLARARHADGSITSYTYQDGRLARISRSNGTVQTPVYVDGTLAMLESSSGKKLGLAPGLRGVDKVAVMPRAARGAGVQSLRGTVAQADPVALNRTLIAIDNWESLRTAWDCVIQPEGDTVCVGQPDQGPGGGGEAGGWLPGEQNPPPDGGVSSNPGDAGGGMPGEGSDRIPPNLNTQESCIAAAKNTWEIMRDQFCPMVIDQTVCLSQNWRLFLDLRQECIAAFPLP